MQQQAGASPPLVRVLVRSFTNDLGVDVIVCDNLAYPCFPLVSDSDGETFAALMLVGQELDYEMHHDVGPGVFAFRYSTSPFWPSRLFGQ